MLLCSDVELTNSLQYKNIIIIIQLKLKSTKEDRIGAGKIMDVYKSPGSLCQLEHCPDI